MSKDSQLEPGKVTICIVNYRTEELTRICLRAIRKFTKYPHRVIVVDNDSQDRSLKYLRKLDWITLIERSGEDIRSGSWAHGSALDKGLAACNTEFFLAMHSDTIVHKEGWLGELVEYFTKNPNCAAVGGDKVELKPAWQVWLKKCTDVKKWIRKLKNPKKLSNRYIRAICSLYRTDVLRKHDLWFTKNVMDGVTCGKQIYFDLIKEGYETILLPSPVMSKYIYHLAHATMVLNPEFEVRKRTEKKCRAQLQKLWNTKLVQELRTDTSLDQGVSLD